jgi:hypothetical protein
VRRLPHAGALQDVHRPLGPQPDLNMQAACVACHKKHDAKASAED